MRCDRVCDQPLSQGRRTTLLRGTASFLLHARTQRPHTHTHAHTHTQPVLTQQWVSSQEKDFGAWKDRLHILMADFRDIRAVEVRLASSFVRFSP
jgi:hypothetical protein